MEFREPVNGLTHLSAAIASGIGLVLLIIISPSTFIHKLAVIIYGVSLVLMFTASSIYHLANVGPTIRIWLRKLDHSAIYLLIAGTYTPVCIYFFSGFWKWGVLITVWLMALVGIVIKLFLIRAPRWLTAGIYLTMGWSAIFAIREILEKMPCGALVWLLIGGLLFTFGAVVYIIKRPNFFPGVFGFHEVWHIFVILGALSHYIMIAAYVAPK